MPTETLTRAQAEWDALEAERDRLRTELDAERKANADLCRAMAHIAGHDRQGLDHLAAATRAEKARANAVAQTRIWYGRFRELEQLSERIAAENHGLRRYRDRLTAEERQSINAREELARRERAAAILSDAAAPLCVCGHNRDAHDFGPAPRTCKACPGDDERTFRHSYQPATRV